MDTIKQALAMWKKQRALVEHEQKKADAMLDAIVKEFHPLKVGDITEVNGYSFRGKKMRVDRVSASVSLRGIEFRASGTVLRADGSPGSNKGTWFSRE